MGLKALAKLALQRDRQRDNLRDTPSDAPAILSHRGGTGETCGGTPISIIPCARCGAPSPPFLAVAHPEVWCCRTCLPDAAELRRRDLTEALMAHAAALAGIMSDPDVLADRQAIRAVDG